MTITLRDYGLDSPKLHTLSRENNDYVPHRPTLGQIPADYSVITFVIKTIV